MVWKKDDPKKLVEERLKIMSPEAVLNELEEYNCYLKERGLGWLGGDSDLEKTLLARNDRLIDLGLAQFSTSGEVLLTLFIRACEATKGVDNESYNHALRLACLSNSNHSWDWPNEGKWKELVDQILLKGKG